MGRDTLSTVDWDDLRFFLVVARRHTLSAAARELDVTQPTVGRRVAALEHRLGAKLFVRRSDGFTLSDAGAQVLELAERMEHDALAIERRVAGRDEGVRGTVRITASEWLVTRVVSPMLGPLLTRYPKMAIELAADQRHLNLARREADLALRPRRFTQDAIVQRATTKIGFALYASPSYLARNGLPVAGDGHRHTVIAMTDDVADLARGWLQGVFPRAAHAVRTNGRDAMVALAETGVGIACLARVVGDKSTVLRRIDISPPPPTPMLWMGVHRDVIQTPRVRAVASYVADRLGELRRELCPDE
jgi:DNA-binding transcriptional LysR family regulator